MTEKNMLKLKKSIQVQSDFATSPILSVIHGADGGICFCVNNMG